MKEQSDQLFPSFLQESKHSLIQKGHYIRTNLGSHDEVPSADLKQMPALSRIASAINKCLRYSGIHVYDEIVLHPELREWVLVYSNSGTAGVCIKKLLTSLRDYMCSLEQMNDIFASHSMKEGEENYINKEGLDKLRREIQKKEKELCRTATINNKELASLVKAIGTTHATSASIMVSNQDGSELLTFPTQAAIINLEANPATPPEPQSFLIKVLVFDPEKKTILGRDMESGRYHCAIVGKAMHTAPPQPGTILKVKNNSDKPSSLNCVDIISVEMPQQETLL